MKTILVAIDFSDVSAKVLANAGELARALGAQVHLVHGVEQLASFYDIYGYTIPDVSTFEEQARDRAEKGLAEKAASMGLPTEQVVTKVLEGAFLDSLLEYGQEISADLLVLGSHGHGLVARVLLGSTAQRVLHRAEIPTLIVPA